MDLKRLKYFVTAARELSFSGAARKLGVSQPVLSKGIKELENELGAQLFVRSTTAVSLTPAGEILLPKADEALSLLDETALSVCQAVRGRNSVLDVAYLPLVLDAFVAPALEATRRTISDTCLRPYEMSTQRQIESLRAGEIDVAIVAFYPDDEMDKEFDLFEICETEMNLVLSSKDPIASQDRAKIESVLSYELIGYGEEDFPACNRALENYFKGKQLPFKPALNANSSQSTMAALAPGNAYTFMSVFGRSIAPDHVTFVPLDPPDYKISFGGLVKRDENRKAVLTFLRECRRAAEAQLARYGLVAEAL